MERDFERAANTALGDLLKGIGENTVSDEQTILNLYESQHPPGKQGAQWVDNWISQSGFNPSVLMRAFLKTVDGEGLVYTDYSNRADKDPPTKYGVTFNTWKDLAKKNGWRSFSSPEEFGAKLTIWEAYNVFKKFLPYVAPFADPLALQNFYDFVFIAPKVGEWAKKQFVDAGFPMKGTKWNDSDQALFGRMDTLAQRAAATAARLDVLRANFGQSEAKLMNLLGWYRRALNSNYLGSEFSFLAFPDFGVAVKKYILDPDFTYMTDRWRKAYFVDPSGLRGKKSPLWQERKGVGLYLSDKHWNEIMSL